MRLCGCVKKRGTGRQKGERRQEETRRANERDRWRYWLWVFVDDKKAGDEVRLSYERRKIEADQNKGRKARRGKRQRKARLRRASVGRGQRLSSRRGWMHACARQRQTTNDLESLSSEPSGEGEVLGLDGDPLGVDGCRGRKRIGVRAGEGDVCGRWRLHVNPPAKLVSSKSETRYASEASCNAITALIIEKGKGRGKGEQGRRESCVGWVRWRRARLTSTGT